MPISLKEARAARNYPPWLEHRRSSDLNLLTSTTLQARQWSMTLGREWVLMVAAA